MTHDDNKPTPLSANEIANRCQALQDNLEVHVLETVGSTNTWLMEGSHASAITLCAAEHQTVGRGRRGKTWHSPNSGVTFSVRFNRSESIACFNGLSLLVGAVLCDCLRSRGVPDAMVKWPNDVLVNNAKLAGILIESRVTGSSSGTCIVIGMGINYKRGAEAGLIDQKSTDLYTLCGENALPDRNLLIADIITRLAQVVTSNAPALLDDLAQDWSQYDALAGHQVRALVGGGDEVTGIACGIDANGGFRIKTKDGLRVLSSAEVSLRIS